MKNKFLLLILPLLFAFTASADSTTCNGTTCTWDSAGNLTINLYNSSGDLLAQQVFEGASNQYAVLSDTDTYGGEVRIAFEAITASYRIVKGTSDPYYISFNNSFYSFTGSAGSYETQAVSDPFAGAPAVLSFFDSASTTIASLPAGFAGVISTTIGGIWPLALLFMATAFAFWILVEIQNFLIKPEKQETKKEYKRGHRTADKYTAKIN